MLRASRAEPEAHQIQSLDARELLEVPSCREHVVHPALQPRTPAVAIGVSASAVVESQDGKAASGELPGKHAAGAVAPEVLMPRRLTHDNTSAPNRVPQRRMVAAEDPLPSRFEVSRCHAASQSRLRIVAAGVTAHFWSPPFRVGGSRQREIRRQASPAPENITDPTRGEPSAVTHFPLDEADAALQRTTATFDASVWAFRAPLLAAVRLVMARCVTHRDPAEMIALRMRRQEVTALPLVSMLLQVRRDHPDLATRRQATFEVR